jgi:hypothetical protein
MSENYLISIMQKHSALIFCLLLMLVLSAYKPTVSSGYKATGYLLEMEISEHGDMGNDTLMYKYDDKDRITNIITLAGYNRKYGCLERKFSYDTKNRVITEFDYISKSNAGPNGLNRRIFYTYFKDHINKHILENAVSRYHGPYIRSLTDTLLLNEHQQVIKHLRSFGDSIHPSYFYDVLTYDAKNRLASLTAFHPADHNKPTYVNTYTYDDSKSRFADVKGNLMFCIAASEINNLKTGHLLMYNETLKTNIGVSNISTYVFNGAGYPIIKNFTATDSDNKRSKTVCHYFYVKK